MGLVEYADRYHAADDQLPVKNHADPKQCVGPDNPNDIITMAAFGVLGCVMNKFGFPQALMALAFVLGPIMGTAQSLISHKAAS